MLMLTLMLWLMLKKWVTLGCAAFESCASRRLVSGSNSPAKALHY